MVFSAGTVTPFAAAVSVHLRRIEGRETPVLTLTQFAAGTTGIMMFLTEAMFWSICAYRPHRSPEITQTLNDIAWFFTVMPFCLIVVQALAIAAAVLSDKGTERVFPRWVGYFNLWAAILYVPGGTITFLSRRSAGMERNPRVLGAGRRLLHLFRRDGNPGDARGTPASRLDAQFHPFFGWIVLTAV